MFSILYTTIICYVNLFVNLIVTFLLLGLKNKVNVLIHLGGKIMNSTQKVWILDSEGLDHDKEISLYHEAHVEYKITTKETYLEDLNTFGKDADAVVAQVGFACTKELINQLDNCKAICTFGMGFNHVDLEAAKEKEIYVSNVPNYCEEEVADHTLALSLTVLRRLFDYNKQVKQDVWDPTNTQPIHRLSQTVIGLLGFGQIARMVAQRFKGFGVTIIAHDRFVDEKVFDEYGVTSVSLDELLEKSNLLSLHIPLTKETKNLIDKEKMEKLPKGAMIINTCRGGIIDEAALAELITSKHISAAGIDVLEQEPPENDNPLVGLEQVIMTPHAAFNSVESAEQMQIETANNVIRAINGEKPLYIVNGLN